MFLLHLSGLLLLLTTCGDGIGSSHIVNPIGGQIETDEFRIAADTINTATEDLTVLASSDIIIEGTLRIVPDVNVTLIADGDITISGNIEPLEGVDEEILEEETSELTFSSPLRGEGGFSRQSDANSSMVLCGQNVSFTTTPGRPVDVFNTETGQDLLMSTRTGEGRVDIDKLVYAGNGKDAENKNENGGKGGSIEIGTPRVLEAVRAKGKKAEVPGYISLQRHISAGHGGRGFSDPGQEANKILVIQSSQGGDGGDLKFIAQKEINLTKARLIPGIGGNGGNCGSYIQTVKGRDGTKQKESGVSVDCTAGNGGKGGNLEASGTSKILGAPDAHAAGGTGGNSGVAVFRAGNGGPAGDGGNSYIKAGKPGQGGTVFGTTQAMGKGIIVDLKGGGNGGDSTNRKYAGGDGGVVVIIDIDGNQAIIDKITIENYGKGGKGFDGCKTSPITDGTNGGSASKLGLPAALVLKGLQATVTGSFDGGAGGDGKTPGDGGTGGTDDANMKIGKDGKNGDVCPGVGFFQQADGETYACNGGCGIDNTAVSVDGNNVTLDPFGSNGATIFEVHEDDENEASNTGLTIFGEPDHQCVLTIDEDLLLTIECTADGTCSEACTIE